MAIDRQLLIECFRAETEEALAELEQAFLAQEGGALDQEAAQAAFRHLHTLKGNAASLGFPALSTFVHQVESAFEPLRSRSAGLTPKVISAALAVIDALRQAMDATITGGQISGAHSIVVENFVAALGGTEPAPLIEREAIPTSQSSRNTHTPSLRVPVEKLDKMLDLIGEIGIANARLRLAVSSDHSLTEQAGIAFEEIERLYLQLQEHVMDARMVPVGPTFRRYARTVRDTAAQLGKLVELVIEGEEVGVDTAVVEAIRDPLMHLLRNAIDHGIETPESRRLAGKPERGRIKLRACHESGTILIEISDDGAGLDRTKIHARAVKLGLVAESERLTAAVAADLILRPGFSTANNITETSGRGVGMDVVHRNVLALHGRLEIQSNEGHGTTVSIRLPLTLAVLDGFLVRVGDDMFVLPLDAIQECVDASYLSGDDCTALIKVRDNMIPAVRLAQLFGYRQEAQSSAILVRHNGGTAALIVDELFGSYQAVIKPLGKMFRKVSGVSGSTILGDGRVALVLDIPGLLREALRAQAALSHS